MRPLPVLFPAAPHKIAKLHCIRLDLEHRQVRPLGGQGRRFQSPLVWFRTLALSWILRKSLVKTNSMINLSIVGFF